MSEEQRRDEAKEALERRLATRLPKDHPDYDPFYDASDEELAGLVPPARVPINRGADAVSSRVYALIFNGLTRGLQTFVPLSEREWVTEAIYEELRQGGIEVRLEDGLAKLREVARQFNPVQGRAD